MSAQPSEFQHETVLLDEVVRFLIPDSNHDACSKIFVDATLGGGGHARALLQKSDPYGTLIGFDRDEDAIAQTALTLKQYTSRTTFVHSEFGEIPEVLLSMDISAVHGLIADLGVSSYQFDEPSRGFSFRNEGPLDMRMNAQDSESALELLHRLKEKELADLLFKYGEERKSFAIAKSIGYLISKGEMQTTADLRRAVVRVLGPRKGKIDPATRTFQAIRIAVNRELEQLQKLLDGLFQILEVGSAVAIISFHSVEDRMVKHFFRQAPWLKPLTKKPITPSEQEIERNPRARSAKLRVAQRIQIEESEEIQSITGSNKRKVRYA